MTAGKNIGSGETLQVRTRAIVLIMLGMLILLSAIAFGFMLIFPNRIGMGFVARHAFPAPAVVPDERISRLALEARQHRVLEGAGGRMPIENAMKAVASRGARAFDPVAP